MQYSKIIAVAGIASLALAGCGSELKGQASAPTTTAAPSTASSAPAAPAGGDTGLTPTGTTLTSGQKATVQYPIKDLSKETTKLEVTASAKKGAISDLKNFDLDAQTKVSDPYYVTMTFHNTGSKAMEPKGIFGLVDAENSDGDKLSRINLIGDFKRCEGTPPDSLAPGASFTECDVYVAPAGQVVDKVVFSFYVDLDKTEITWKVG